MTRTLLIDADIVAYQSTAANERTYDWGDGVTSKVSDFSAAKRAAAETIDHLADTLKADAVIVCLSDDVQNFRKNLYPAYKSNRTGERPEHLYDLKDWLAGAYKTDMRPWLEADDVMGILSTEPHEGQRIIVSADKDMQTVPGWLFNPNKDKKPRRITREQANRFLLWQTLVGDQTDGYPGCPGCGPKTADKLLDGHEWFKTEREITRGKRKGEIDVTWDLLPTLRECTPWSAVLTAYHKAGLTAKDAILQANLARILKHGDMQGNRVIPWEPAHLN